MAASGPKQGAGKDSGAEATSSVANYIPTPYRDTQWAVVGKRWPSRDFCPIELQQVGGDRQVDKFFENFGAEEEEKIEEEKAVTVESVQVDLAVKYEVEIENAYHRGLAEGKRIGAEEAGLAIAERYEKLQTRTTEFYCEITEAWEQFQYKLESKALNLALTVARKILSTTAEVKPEYIFEVVKQGLRAVGAGRPLRVRVSGEDMEFIKVIGAPPEISAEELGVEYVVDEAVRSGCVIETDFGEVDVELDKMWEQVCASIYEANS